MRKRLALACLFLSHVCLANGRFPRAQRLVQSATQPNDLALYGTYGLIVSSDAGSSWTHICEAATGTYTGEDPLLEILPDGRLVVRTEAALVRTTDSWCTWKTIRDGSAKTIQDITRDTTAQETLLALLGSYDATAGFSSMVVESADGGSSWSPEKSLPLVRRGLSIDVAPTSAKRVVVSGLDASGQGRLLISDDRGSTWQGRQVPGTDSNAAPYLAVISAKDPNRIFVRTDAYQAVNGVDTADDALLMSVDGGTSFATLIQHNAKLFGFALSPDESTVLVGYGDPVVAATYVEPADLGIYRASMADILADTTNAASHFEKIFDASVTCLRWTTTGLYACTSQTDRGFEVGRANDATFTIADTNPFTPLLVLSSVRPLACPAGTNGYACYSDPDNGFASVCRTFQTSCDASAPPAGSSARDSGLGGSSGGPPSSAGFGDAAAGGAAVAGGPPAAVGAGGGVTTSVGAGAGSAGVMGVAATASPGDKSAGTCGCRIHETRGDRAPAWGAVAATLVALALRRRRRQPTARIG